jgi:2-amino-4-hydroxy-6-hydroxymethyldihydropteridine diphosphokinase
VIYLGLGSNLGARQKNIREAVSSLQKNAVAIEKISTIIETKPVGGPPQDKYLNAVVKCQTDLSPIQLLTVIQKIEKNLGRQRVIVNGPRTIDIDILLYGRLRISSAQLLIPHPRMSSRDFVMLPLKEIEPKLAEEIMSESH